MPPFGPQSPLPHGPFSAAYPSPQAWAASGARCVLRLRYPHSGLIQDQPFERADFALQAAYAHFAAFPAGLAQLSDPTGAVIHSHEELLEMYQRRAK